MKKRLFYWALSLLLIAAAIAWLVHWSQRDRLIYQQIYLAPGADKPVIAKTYEFGGEGVGFVPEGACRYDATYELPCLPLGYGVVIDPESGQCTLTAYISLYKKLRVTTKIGRNGNPNNTEVKLTGNEEADLEFYAPNKVFRWIIRRDDYNNHGWAYNGVLARVVPIKTVNSKEINGFRWDIMSEIYTQYKNGEVVQSKKVTDQEFETLDAQFDSYAGDPEVNQRATQWLEDQYIQFEKQLGMSIPRDCNRFVADLKKEGLYKE
jgi:hypothetical protein